MQFKRESEYQLLPFLVKFVAGYPSGLTLAVDDISLTDELPGGALIAEDSNGHGRLVKTAKIHADAADNATTYQVEKGHPFKTGQHVVDTKLTGAARTINSINRDNSDYDVLTLSATLGIELLEDSVIIEAEAVATATNGVLKYKPMGVSLTVLDLTKQNQQLGVMLDGIVNEANCYSPVDDAIKEMHSMRKITYLKHSDPA